MRSQHQGAARLSQEAFTAMVDHHQQRLLIFLRGLVGQPEQAFDLVQDTFYEAWQATQKSEPPFTADTADEVRYHWLFRAAYHNALSALRRKRLIQWEPLEAVPELPDPQHLRAWSFEEQVVEGDALLAALAQLPPQDVACLLLRVVQGFSATEVGAIVGTSADNVNKRLSRAKQRLRTVYFQQNDQIEEHTHR